MPELSPEDIRRIARLARLAVPEDRMDAYRGDLGSILGYVERLGELDLDGVEPLTHPGGGAESGGGAASNRLDEDEPGPVLANDVIMGLAPDPKPPYFSVPKVLGDGAGA